MFLGSYIHDACFQIESISLREKTLHVAMQRDRWERFNRLKKLERISCELTISPVFSIAWECKRKLVRKKFSPRDGEFRIRHVYLGESYWDDSDQGEIIFSGHGKRPCELRIAVSDLFFIRLRDRTEKKPGKRSLPVGR